MKIFSAGQIRACDAYTIHSGSISALDLMERAAGKCFEWISEHFSRDIPFIVLCGTGNNGGDGLVIARRLYQAGYNVKAFLLELSQELTAGCSTNYQRLKSLDETLVVNMAPDMHLTDLPSNIVIIDAIFGSGLNRPVEGWIGTFIDHINHYPNRKLSIDLPSGLPADSVVADDAPVIHADDTLSFQFYKRSFLHPETGPFAGNIHLLDIGLSETFIHATPSNYQITDRNLLLEFFRQRRAFTHKGDYGNAQLIGGSYGMMGAVVLAGKAAVRSGAGKVKVLVPECGYGIIQTAVPEAMCTTSGEKLIGSIRDWEQADAIGIGPGLGTAPGTIRVVESFVADCQVPLVVDADGLNILALKPDLLKKLPPGSILTPHPKEFERLFGSTANSMLRLELARTQAMRFNLTIVLKDRHTVVVGPGGECWYNITGNSGLATGGSGDVLTGLVTGLLAQGYEPVQAAQLGVYLHGLAADLSLIRESQESMTPSDVTDHLGMAFRQLQQSLPG